MTAIIPSILLVRCDCSQCQNYMKFVRSLSQSQFKEIGLLVLLKNSYLPRKFLPFGVF